MDALPPSHSNAASIQFYTPSIRPATGKLVRNLGRISMLNIYIYIYKRRYVYILLHRVETIVAMKSLSLFLFNLSTEKKIDTIYNWKARFIARIGDTTNFYRFLFCIGSIQYARNESSPFRSFVVCVGVEASSKSARRYFYRLKVWRALKFIAIAYGYAFRRDEAKMWTKWRGKGRKEERSSPISTTALSYGAIVATCRRSCSTNFSMSIYIFRVRPFMSC